MAITRTPIIDDDGTGTTGTVIDNAWKTELYNQMDAAYGGAQSSGAWTPVDGSGAGLVFAYGAGTWVRAGYIVVISFQVVYPATSNGAAAQIGGLPFAAAAPFAGSQGIGALLMWNGPASAAVVAPMSPTTAVQQTNAQMSGMNVIVSAVYITT